MSLSSKERLTCIFCALTFISTGLMVYAGRANVLTYVALILAVLCFCSAVLRGWRR